VEDRRVLQAVGLPAAAVRRHPGKNFFTFPYDWRRDNRAPRVASRSRPTAGCGSGGGSSRTPSSSWSVIRWEGWWPGTSWSAWRAGGTLAGWSPLAPRTGGAPVSLVQAPDLSCRRRPPCCPRRQAAVLPFIKLGPGHARHAVACGIRCSSLCAAIRAASCRERLTDPGRPRSSGQRAGNYALSHALM
jgi:hypothetical protein